MTILKKRRSHSRSFKFWQGFLLLGILFSSVAVIPGAQAQFYSQAQAQPESHAQVWSMPEAQIQFQARPQAQNQEQSQFYSQSQSQSGAQTQALKRYEFSDQQMGTTFKITFYAPGDSIAKAASERAFQHTDTLNSILSDYEPHSNLNLLSERS